MPSPTKVFISYSHDSADHEQRVRALADRLRADGIEAWIDQYAPDPDEGWPAWMRSQVAQADRILLVFTEIYARRFLGSETQGIGLGVTFEGVLATQSLYESGARNAKFRPVVFSEEDEKFIPKELRRFNRYRVDTQDHYQNLLRWLHAAPRIVVPSVGDRPDLPPEPVPELFLSKPGESQVPSIGPSQSAASHGARQLAPVNVDKRHLITSIEFTLERPFTEFNEEKFKIALKLATGIDASQIRIASIRSGSTIVQIDGEQETLATMIRKIQFSKQVAHQLALQIGVRKIAWEIDGARHELTVDEFTDDIELAVPKPAIVQTVPLTQSSVERQESADAKTGQQQRKAGLWRGISHWWIGLNTELKVPVNKPIQVIFAFAFGVVFAVVMLVIAIDIPYPTDFQFLTFRVILALAAGGIAGMLPGFLSVDISKVVRAGGALAAFAAIYFLNPASLAIQGHPSQALGVFVTELPQDRNLVEYFWKQADVRFRFPSDGWKISTKAAEVGLGDMTLQHASGKDAQIQIHVSVLDDKYRDKWSEFEANTVGIWKGTISQFGPFSFREVFVDGRSAFRISGVLRGEVQGLKKIDLIYAPLGDNRLLEIHLTRNDDNQHNSDLERAFDLIISTIQFVR